MVGMKEGRWRVNIVRDVDEVHVRRRETHMDQCRRREGRNSERGLERRVDGLGDSNGLHGITF